MSRSLGFICQIYWKFGTSTKIFLKRPVDSLIHQYLIELLKREYQADIKQRDLQLARSKQQVTGADSEEQAQQIELMKQQYRVVIEQHDRQNQQLSA